MTVSVIRKRCSAACGAQVLPACQPLSPLLYFTDSFPKYDKKWSSERLNTAPLVPTDLTPVFVCKTQCWATVASQAHLQPGVRRGSCRQRAASRVSRTLFSWVTVLVCVRTRSHCAGSSSSTKQCEHVRPKTRTKCHNLFYFSVFYP